jgi:uncharacterized protein YjbI with pentapeptide repeats
MSQLPLGQAIRHAQDDAIQRQFDELTTEMVGQEHRFYQVLRNLTFALGLRRDWPKMRRVEAVVAFGRYFLTAPILIIALGGSIAGLHASFMWADQNQKLDLQNYLTLVSSEVTEAQRNSQLVQLISPLVNEFSASTRHKPSKRNKVGLEVKLADSELNTRIAVLSRTLEPYRWVSGTRPAKDVVQRKGDGGVYRVMGRVRLFFDAAFGNSELERILSETTLPVLTKSRLSPERGMLLTSLHSRGADLLPLIELNARFTQIYAPGARLERVDLGTDGPSFSLQESLLSGAFFNGAHLQNVNFTDSTLRLANFELANVRGAIFSGAQLQRASFLQASARDAFFEKANLDNANFRSANLVGANLSAGLNVAKSFVSEACMDPRSTLMPQAFNWHGYQVPGECCRLWPEDFAFEKGSSACLPRTL